MILYDSILGEVIMMVDFKLLDEIIEICKKMNATEVVLFGSRAKDTALERSDYDIAVSGIADIFELEDALDAIDTLYKIDIVDLEHCRNSLLLEDIKKYGVKIL